MHIQHIPNDSTFPFNWNNVFQWRLLQQNIELLCMYKKSIEKGFLYLKVGLLKMVTEDTYMGIFSKLLSSITYKTYGRMTLLCSVNRHNL